MKSAITLGRVSALHLIMRDKAESLATSYYITNRVKSKILLDSISVVAW